MEGGRWIRSDTSWMMPLEGYVSGDSGEVTDIGHIGDG